MPVVEEKTCDVPVLPRYTVAAGSEYQQAAASASVLFYCSSVRCRAALSRLGKALLTSMASRTWSGRS
eukprot:5160373-Prorocentrum_lima.AAC.1